MTLTRTARVLSPVQDKLLLYSLWFRESLGRPFACHLELLAPDERLDLSALLGQTLTVELELGETTVRELTGFVTTFELAGELGRYVRYRAELRPWLWLLNHTHNCRIFQNQTIPEVIKSIFREHGFTDFVESLSSEYRTWEYLVQYRESDFNFVSRLMEQEGIYYFFRHASGKHQLILADSYSAHEATPDYAELPYYPPQTGEQRERDHIYSWRATRRIRPGAFTARDFDFERPNAKLGSTLRAPREHAQADYEIYDYPGDFRDSSEADTQVRLRLEEAQADHDTVRGGGNARGLLAGALFTLTEFPREDQNKEYLVSDMECELRISDYESGTGGGEDSDYRCSFVALDSTRPFRARHSTRKPVVEGPQTAVVVGQQDQEIWTDEYGRVKVQFHWDRNGAFDENSSCWVRVAQLWAGSGFGGLHIPRIGQEVIVDFLEGDPDRPIVTGRIYNADNMPPYALPQNQSQSGIKSRSTKDASPGNFNEMRFEDKKGEEELFVQAEKNHTINVKNDQSTTVGASRSASVGGSDSVSVSGDRSVSVQGNLTVTVQGQGKGPTQSSVSVTGKHNLSASDTIDMDAPTHVKLVCGGSSITIEPGKITISAGGGAQVVLDSNLLAQSSAGSNLVLDGNATTESSGGSKTMLDANVLAESSGGSKVVLDANVLNQSSGGAQVVLDANALLKGAQATVQGDSSAQLDSSGNVKADPSGVTIMGAMVKLN